MDTLVFLASLIALGYVVLYVRSMYVKENFKTCNTVLDTSTQAQVPYMTTEHTRGDFEQDFIYQTEGGRDTDRDAIDMARRKFPFDWSQLPPDSSLFQAQQAMFVKDPTTKASPFKHDTYANIEAIKVLPPDMSKEAADEADILAKYQPRKTRSMKVVDEKDVNRLIQDIYGEKGLVASVAKKANNVYEVYEVREKNPTIVWEDDVQSSMQSNELNSKVSSGEMLVVPSAVGDVQSGLVPYGAGEKTNLSRREYTDYNPNLEGIFGPKMQWQQWG
jgi:hypothetical protein